MSNEKSTKQKNKKGLSVLLQKLVLDSGDATPNLLPSPISPSSSHSPSRHFQTTVETKRRQKRILSSGNLQELLQCPLCLEQFVNPKMLSCQHTFCYACIKTYAAKAPTLECPVCRLKISINKEHFIDSLPSNLYIDSFLEVMSGKSHSPVTPPSTPCNNVELIPVTSNSRCVTCKTMCDIVITKSCGHCKQERCERLRNQIDQTTEEKIKLILEQKICLLGEATSIEKQCDLSALGYKTTLDDTKRAVVETIERNYQNITDAKKVEIFMNLHRSALNIISDISKWEGSRFSFDKESYRIETNLDTQPETVEPVLGGVKDHNPLEGEDSLIMHYRSRNFVPHYIWKKTCRPAGVACSPWNDLLYICGMDSHSVVIVERTHAKVVSKLTCEEMLCPVHITFLKTKQEIYVTDKWKHCIHVFSAEGEYLRSFGSKGSRPGQFRSPEGIVADDAHNMLYVVDTGNDRVQVIQSDGTYKGQIGVITKPQPDQSTTIWQLKDAKCNEFHAPTDVALFGDRIIVLDSGNKRVKIYNKHNMSKILEFGSFGRMKGQFRQPEVLAVDPFGFIIVGDSGNSRVQVFKPNGMLVRVFGGSGTKPGGFGWISGIFITEQLDFIISDTKNHSVNFF